MTGPSRGGRWAAAALLVATSVATAVTAVRAPTPAIAAAPPSQRVVMFTDSVGLGARSALPRAFPADWQVVVDGQPARMVGQLEQQYVRPRLATNPSWFGDHVVIAAGYNFPYWDHARFVREVDSLVNTLTAAGVKHVYWVTLREVKPQFISASAWRQVQPYYWYFPDVNDLLEQALERHPNLHLVDWAAVADQPGLTYDAIHLNTTGAALYSGIIRAAVDGVSTTVPDGSTTRIHVPGGETATAAAINIATTHPRAAGVLTAHPCGRVPLVSMHNHRRGEVVAHSSIVPLDANGDFCVTTRVATNLVVDVTGVFRRGGDFTSVAPTRWIDTRTGDGAPLAHGATIALDIDDVRAAAGVSGAPSAVAVSATAVGAAGPGFLRVTTCGSDAETSNVNFTGPAASPNHVIVELDDAGRICVEAYTTTHVIVDLFGVFSADSTTTANAPVRLFDSRLRGAPVAAGSVERLAVADAGVAPDATGVVVNLTTVDTESPAFVTAYPCAEGRPPSSSINTSNDVVSNAAIITPDERGEICVYSYTTTHLVVDVMGEVGTSFDGFSPIRVLDTRLAPPG